MSVENVPRDNHAPRPEHELRIIKRLALRLDFFDGVTTPRQRGERLRKHLDEHRVGHERAFRASDETWYEACERWYGVGALTSSDQPQPETV